MSLIPFFVKTPAHLAKVGALLIFKNYGKFMLVYTIQIDLVHDASDIFDQ
jgi:hypothetical protein